MGGCGAVVQLRWWWRWGYAFANARQVAGAKTHKTEHDGSVSGAPYETAMKGNGERWWDEVDKVMVMVGLCVRKCEVGEGPRGQIRRNRA
jgi:hypothetical protein